MANPQITAYHTSEIPLGREQLSVDWMISVDHTAHMSMVVIIRE
jgi:hypothetical protein